MILTTLCGPFSALYVCGGLALALVPLGIGGVLAVYLNSEVTPGDIGTGDMTAAAGATGVVAVYFLLLFYMILWRNIESYFSSLPWLSEAQTSKETVGQRAYQKLCPFTGLRPTFRCPSCQCRVHEQAFHAADRFIALPVGETILRWDLAKQATEMDDVDKGRAALDEAMDFRGNLFTESVGGCCIGCATWQKCFNLAARLSLSLALSALFFAYIPWAFTSFLVLIDRAGAIVKMVTGSVAVGFAIAALLVQTRALGRANAFLSKHQESVPALRPLKKVSETGWGAAVGRALFSTRWDPLM